MSALQFPGGSIDTSAWSTAPYVPGEHPTTIGTDDEPSIVEAPKPRPRVNPDVAAYEADVYKQKRDARAARKGGLR